MFSEEVKPVSKKHERGAEAYKASRHERGWETSNTPWRIHVQLLHSLSGNNFHAAFQISIPVSCTRIASNSYSPLLWSSLLSLNSLPHFHYKKAFTVQPGTTHPYPHLRKKDFVNKQKQWLPVGFHVSFWAFLHVYSCGWFSDKLCIEVLFLVYGWGNWGLERFLNCLVMADHSLGL